jgi:hypothetical protein
MSQLSSLRFWLIVTSAIIFHFSADAQGSSDTGVSSMSVFKPIKEILTPGKRNWMTFGLSAESADFDIAVLTPQIGYSRQFGKHFSVDSRITAGWHSGNGVSSFGLGDILANVNYLLFDYFTLTGGIKLRLNRADKFYSDEIVYPMDYQSSLGSIDFYSGISYHPGDWHFVLIWQHPFVQNENWFYPDELVYPDSPFNEFPGTYGFIREGDLIFRLAKSFSLTDKLSVTPGILPVYHLEKDWLPDSNDGYEQVIGSDGLTLNITLLSLFNLNEKSKLEINLGFPVLERDVQLEGLSRSFCLSGGYLVSF